jgi:ATP-dependent DNA helicase RecQ
VAGGDGALVAAAPDAAGEAGRYARLKAWRLAEARRQAVPAYVILHDATLAEIARRRPRDVAALADIPGIGARKLERYGASLLEVLGDA